MDVREKLVELVKLAGVRDKGVALRIADCLVINGVTVRECGHWDIFDDGYGCELMSCSVCKSEFYDGDNDTVDQPHKYCPNCGAKMMPQPPKGE